MEWPPVAPAVSRHGVGADMYSQANQGCQGELALA